MRPFQFRSHFFSQSTKVRRRSRHSRDSANFHEVALLAVRVPLPGRASPDHVVRGDPTAIDTLMNIKRSREARLTDFFVAKLPPPVTTTAASAKL
jgi:hypothetical protein